MTYHCHRCGWEWKYAALPGRSDVCPQCKSELRVCKNCARYDERAAYECAEPKADPIPDKERSNFCEWFSFAKRKYVPNLSAQARAQAARDQLKKLLGD